MSAWKKIGQGQSQGEENRIRWTDGAFYEGIKTGHREVFTKDGKALDVFELEMESVGEEKETRTLLTSSKFLHENLVPVPMGKSVRLSCFMDKGRKLWGLEVEE